MFSAYHDVMVHVCTCALLFARLICQRVTILQVQTLARKSYRYDKCRALCCVSFVSLPVSQPALYSACCLPVHWFQCGCSVLQTESVDGKVVVLINTVLGCDELLR